MIDWFVLFTPFILLAIFLLFVFVGCDVVSGLSEFEIGVYVSFSYDPGLGTGDSLGPAIHRFLAEISFKNEIIGTVERTYLPFEGEDPPPPALNHEKGESTPLPTSVGLNETGAMICTCHIWKQSAPGVEGDQVVPSPSSEKMKTMGGTPSFTLQRDPDPSADFRVI